MKENVKKRGRPAGAGSQLNSERIVACARILLKEEGKIPSIRRLSGELGVDAMAIYHYFSSKAVLLEAVTVALLEDIYEPDPVDEWQEQIKKLCTSYLQLLKAHPGLLQTLLTMKGTGPAQIFCQRFDVVVASLGLKTETAKHVLDLLVDYLHGFALAIECQKDALSDFEAYLEGPLALVIKIMAQEAQQH